MNTVMMNRLLRRTRRGLNLIIVGAYTLKALGWSALLSGILMMLTRFWGWSGAGFLTWIIFTGAGGLFGWVAAFGCKRLDETAAARWIDARFGFQEALTSALICIERDCSGPLDAAIVERAQRVTANPPQIRWPLRRLYQQALQAGILMGVTTLGLILVPAQLGIDFRFAIPNQVKRNPVNQTTPAGKPPVSQRLSPREMAKLLFPQDSKLAIQAEQAILAGNMDALRELLHRATLNPETGNIDQSAPASKNPSQSLRKQLMQSIASADSMEEVRNMADQNQARQDRSTDSESQEQDQPATNVAKKPSKGSKQNPNQPRQDPRSQQGNPNQDLNQLKLGTYAYRSSLPGRGAGTDKGSSNKITPQSDSRKKPIILMNKGGYFEYLLPGKDSRVPLTGILPGATQATEQALARQGAPGEYADFTRAYFLKLSQFITGSSP